MKCLKLNDWYLVLGLTVLTLALLASCCAFGQATLEVRTKDARLNLLSVQAKLTPVSIPNASEADDAAPYLILPVPVTITTANGLGYWSNVVSGTYTVQLFVNNKPIVGYYIGVPTNNAVFNVRSLLTNVVTVSTNYVVVVPASWWTNGVGYGVTDLQLANATNQLHKVPFQLASIFSTNGAPDLYYKARVDFDPTGVAYADSMLEARDVFGVSKSLLIMKTVSTNGNSAEFYVTVESSAASPSGVFEMSTNGVTTFKLDANGTLTVGGSINVTNGLFLPTQTTPPSVAGGGTLWNSNSVLFWITATKTNLVSDGQ